MCLYAYLQDQIKLNIYNIPALQYPHDLAQFLFAITSLQRSDSLYQVHNLPSLTLSAQSVYNSKLMNSAKMYLSIYIYIYAKEMRVLRYEEKVCVQKWNIFHRNYHRKDFMKNLSDSNLKGGKSCSVYCVV